LEAAQRGLNPIAPLELRRERAKHPLTLSPLTPLPPPQGRGKRGRGVGVRGLV
jgi:hypothetical protein